MEREREIESVSIHIYSGLLTWFLFDIILITKIKEAKKNALLTIGFMTHLICFHDNVCPNVLYYPTIEHHVHELQNNPITRSPLSCENN